jgi:hypothetical protein
MGSWICMSKFAEEPLVFTTTTLVMIAAAAT